MAYTRADPRFQERMKMYLDGGSQDEPEDIQGAIELAIIRKDEPSIAWLLAKIMRRLRNLDGLELR